MKYPSYLTLLALTFLMLPFGCTSDGQATDTTMQPLFNKYFKPYRNVLYTINKEPKNDNEKAFLAYSKKEYKEALPQIENLIQHDKGNDWFWFYKGQCLLALNKPADAITILERVIEYGKEGRFYKETQWYLSLAYMLTGNAEKRDAYMKQVMENQNFFAAQATALQEELKLLRK